MAVEQIAKEVGLSPATCPKCGYKWRIGKLIDRFFERIVDTARDRGLVRLQNFGTFRCHLYKGRELTSPILENGSMIFDDVYVLKFQQSAAAKRRLNESDLPPPPQKKGKGKDKDKSAAKEKTAKKVTKKKVTKKKVIKKWTKKQ
jgi:nucleoid DNA-binding protein